MTTLRTPAPSAPATGRRVRLRSAAGRLVTGAVSVVPGRAVPVASHLRDHAYSIAGLGFISAAGFIHSLFTGLLVTGILILVFEWKVSE